MLHFVVRKVIKNINGSNIVIYGINGQVPGPTLIVKHGSTVFVNLINNLDMPTTIHWHGLKLQNKYDGVSGITQSPIKPGRSFLCELNFTNEGVYWYHSHYREDEQQNLGMCGVILVQPKSNNYYNPVDLKVPLALSDILMINGSVYPLGKDHEYFALMGRDGNVMVLKAKQITILM